MLAVGVMIFGVHRYTDLDTVRAQNREQRELLAQVMPQASFSSETPYRAAGALSILGGYSGENELLGYCVEVQSQGFGGPITMVVGVDLDGKVTGVAVTDHRENRDTGAKALTPAALSRYVGKAGTIRASGSNSVDAVSGATATSHAITAGVNRRWPSWLIWIRKERTSTMKTVKRVEWSALERGGVALWPLFWN